MQNAKESNQFSYSTSKLEGNDYDDDEDEYKEADSNLNEENLATLAKKINEIKMSGEVKHAKKDDDLDLDIDIDLDNVDTSDVLLDDDDELSDWGNKQTSNP